MPVRCWRCCLDSRRLQHCLSNCCKLDGLLEVSGRLQLPTNDLSHQASSATAAGHTFPAVLSHSSRPKAECTSSPGCPQIKSVKRRAGVRGNSSQQSTTATGSYHSHRTPLAPVPKEEKIGREGNCVNPHARYIGKRGKRTTANPVVPSFQTHR